MKRSISSKFGRRVGALLLAIAALTASTVATAGLYLSVTIAPPVLPVYEQPLIPGPGYIWTPGYWAWGPDGYYWVPGTWVVAPFVGALWTPGYWGWGGGVYLWHAGYWGPHVGFYGGVNYGFGYTGVGYQGGYWQHGSFCYNRAVNRVNVTNITNTYNTTVINRTTTRVSYNGGSGGVVAQPTSQDRLAERDRHTPLLPVQAHHELAASSNRALLASVNHGHPTVAATARPARFAAGSAPARSFSQLAAVRPAPVPPRSSGVGPTSHASNAQPAERRNAPVKAGPAQSQAAPPAQAPVRAPSARYPQASPQALAQRQAPPQVPARPQGPQQAQTRPQAPVHPSAQSQGAPPQRGPRGGPEERQHS